MYIAWRETKPLLGFLPLNVPKRFEKMPN